MSAKRCRACGRFMDEGRCRTTPTPACIERNRLLDIQREARHRPKPNMTWRVSVRQAIIAAESKGDAIRTLLDHMREISRSKCQWCSSPVYVEELHPVEEAIAVLESLPTEAL